MSGSYKLFFNVLLPPDILIRPQMDPLWTYLFLNYLQIAVKYFQNYFNSFYYLDRRMGAILIHIIAYESEYYSMMVGSGRMKKKEEKVVLKPGGESKNSNFGRMSCCMFWSPMGVNLDSSFCSLININIYSAII